MLASLLAGSGYDLDVITLEVGALRLGAEPFHRLLRVFSSARNMSIEPDPILCEKMNRSAPRGLQYHACALGRRREPRTFYLTEHSMCCSLYPPDERWPRLFQNLEVMRLKGTTTVDTVSLDDFRQTFSSQPIDFIKIDIQGAELEVFEGGIETLRDTLCIVTEVEFVPLYVGQPLFADVDKCLRAQGFQFHKFLGVAGRSVRPIVLNNDESFATQHMWADAIYLKEFDEGGTMAPIQLLKMAVLMDLYASYDLAFYLLQVHDRQENTNLAQAYAQKRYLRSALAPPKQI